MYKMRKYSALNTQFYDQIREMILTNQFEYNIIYSETKLAASLSVSRTPIHDALVRLSQEHYIDIIPSKGFMLHYPNETDLCNARHFRLAIESYCAESIASNVKSVEGKAIIKRMNEILELQRKQANVKNSKTFWRLDVQFHEQIVSSLCNSYFDALYVNSHHTFTSLSVEEFFEVGRDIATLKEHEAILKGLAAGDVEATICAVRKHVDESLNAIKRNSKYKEDQRIAL